MNYGFYNEPCSRCEAPLTVHCAGFDGVPSNAAWRYSCPKCNSSELYEYGPYYLLKEVPDEAVSASPVVKPDPPREKPIQGRFAAALEVP